MSDSVKLHPRTHITNRARAAISDSVLSAFKTYGLTFTELLFILADESHSWAATAVKAEREDKPERIDGGAIA